MDHYGRARRDGLRVYSAAIQANEDPYLPVLEDKVPGLAQLSRLSLGVMSVPLERVIGSVSQGRSYAFTSNFLPILDGGSEFASKWEQLFESVEAQGVNQPITALEYMGYYYVIEGNKRTSVMKSMGAEDIEADVTRVYPVRTQDPEVIAYYEYCDFTKETGFYGLLLTRPGSYEKLCSLPGMRAGEKWTEDEILSLRKIYHYFRASYLDQTKDRRVMQTGDAFLSYLIAFGYKDVRDNDMETTSAHIRLMLQVSLSCVTTRSTLSWTPVAQQPGPLISSLFRPNKIKAAFLFNRGHDSAWNYWHNLGRLEAGGEAGRQGGNRGLHRTVPD